MTTRWARFTTGIQAINRHHSNTNVWSLNNSYIFALWVWLTQTCVLVALQYDPLVRSVHFQNLNKIRLPFCTIMNSVSSLSQNSTLMRPIEGNLNISRLLMKITLPIQEAVTHAAPYLGNCPGGALSSYAYGIVSPRNILANQNISSASLQPKNIS